MPMSGLTALTFSGFALGLGLGVAVIGAGAGHDTSAMPAPTAAVAVTKDDDPAGNASGFGHGVLLTAAQNVPARPAARPLPWRMPPVH